MMILIMMLMIMMMMVAKQAPSPPSLFAPRDLSTPQEGQTQRRAHTLQGSLQKISNLGLSRKRAGGGEGLLKATLTSVRKPRENVLACLGMWVCSARSQALMLC